MLHVESYWNEGIVPWIPLHKACPTGPSYPTVPLGQKGIVPWIPLYIRPVPHVHPILQSHWDERGLSHGFHYIRPVPHVHPILQSHWDKRGLSHGFHYIRPVPHVHPILLSHWNERGLSHGFHYIRPVPHVHPILLSHWDDRGLSHKFHYIRPLPHVHSYPTVLLGYKGIIPLAAQHYACFMHPFYAIIHWDELRLWSNAKSMSIYVRTKR